MPDKYQSTLTAQEIEDALKKIAKGEAQGTVPFFDFAQGSDYKQQALSLPIGQAVFHIAAQSGGEIEPGWRFVKMVNNRVDWTGEYLIVDEKNSIAMDAHNDADNEGNYIDVEINNNRIEDPFGSNEKHPYTPASIKITKERNGRSSFRVKNDLSEKDQDYFENEYTYISYGDTRLDDPFLGEQAVATIIKTPTDVYNSDTQEKVSLPIEDMNYIYFKDGVIRFGKIYQTDEKFFSYGDSPYIIFTVTDNNDYSADLYGIFEYATYSDYFYAWHPNSNELVFVDSIEGYEDIDTFTIDYDAIANETAIVGAAGHHLRSTGSRFRLYKATTYSQQKSINLYKWMYDNPEEEDINKLIINTDGTAAGLKIVDPSDTALYYCIGMNRFYHWRPDIMQMVAVGGSIVLGFDENSAYPGNEGNNNRQSILQLSTYIHHVEEEATHLYRHTFLIEDLNTTDTWQIIFINSRSDKYSVNDLHSVGSAVSTSLKAVITTPNATIGSIPVPFDESDVISVKNYGSYDRIIFRTINEDYDLNFESDPSGYQITEDEVQPYIG